MVGATRAAVVLVAIFLGVALGGVVDRLESSGGEAPGARSARGQRGAARIIGGTAATSSAYPIITWQVALETRTGNVLRLCGGSIVSPTMVLTAAHCVRDLSSASQTNPQSMVVIPGLSRANGGSGSRSVLRYFVEPSYTGSRSQQQRIDLAMVEVSSPFTLGSGVGVIPMCTSACYAANTKLIVSGYGQTQSSSSSTSLLYATQLAIDQAECVREFQSSFSCSNCLPRTNICAGPDPPGSTKDSCFGDSGGPLVRDVGNTSTPQFQLVGVVSSSTVPAGQSPSCAVAGEYGLYVAVEQNQAWIQRVMAGAENANAVTPACVAAGTCAPITGTGGGTTTTSFFGWYYVFLLASAGILLIVMLIMCIIRYCRRRHRPRSSAVHASALYPVVMVPPSAPPQRQQSYAVPPLQTPSAPPPPYGAPVYQQQSQSQPPLYGGPAPVGPPMYAPQPQMYGSQPPAYPPPPTAYAPPPPAVYGQTTEYGQTAPPPGPPPSLPPYNPNR